MNKKVTFIGIIHSPYATREAAPHQNGEEVSQIEIYKRYRAGLKDIAGFSHLHIFYWLHKAKKTSLIVNAPWDKVPHGLFATRSPNRINPIGYAVVALIKRKGNRLFVQGLDAITRTPVLDIKPYVSAIDLPIKTRQGWLRKYRTVDRA